MKAGIMAAIAILAILLLCAPIKATDRQNHPEKRVDDTSVSSLEVEIHQQSGQILTLLARLDAQQKQLADMANENAALRTDVATLSSRLAALSKPVAFTVRFSGDNVSHGIAIGSNAPLRFDDVDFNSGNGYDPQTGFFTAPVAGTYAFFLTQMGSYNHGIVYLAIVKHDIVLDIVYSEDHEDQGSGQVTTHLSVGERVWVRHYRGTGVRGDWFTVFTGYLLQADYDN